MESNSTPRIPPVLALAFAILAVSTASIFIRFAQQDAPSLVIAAYRMVLATLILAPSALTTYRKEIASFPVKILLLALLSGIFLALHFASWITSLEYTSVASSVVFVNTAPIWVAFASPIFLNESLSRYALLGLGLAFTGGILIGLSDACTLQGFHITCSGISQVLQTSALTGNLLALFGAICAAGYIMIGRRLRVGMSLIGYTFIVYGFAALILAVTVMATHQPVWGFPTRTYLWFLLLALVPQLLGHSTYNWALRYVSAAFVSIGLLGEPIGSTILAAIFLNEIPSSTKIFGAILILTGIYFASRSEAHSR